MATKKKPFQTHIKNLEPRNVQYTNKMLFFIRIIQRLVTFFDEEFKNPVENCLSHGTHGVVALVHVLTFCDELRAHFYSGLHETVVQLLAGYAEHFSGFVTRLCFHGNSFNFFNSMATKI